MFQLLPCSHCQRTYSVRTEVSEAALLKCPNCGNQFRIGELLDALYAPWQVVEDPGVAGGAFAMSEISSAIEQPGLSTSIDVSDALPGSSYRAATSLPISSSTDDLVVIEDDDLDSAEFANSIDQDSVLRLGPPDALSGGDGDGVDAASSNRSAIDFADAPSATDNLVDGSLDAENLSDEVSDDKHSAAGWSGVKASPRTGSRRGKASERSSIWSTLQVVLGGAAAIPVSLLLIWYVLGKDVAGAGPAVAQYLPWIVPAKFHGRPASVIPVERVTSASSNRTAPQSNGGGFRRFDDVLPTTSPKTDGAPTSKSQDARDTLDSSLALESVLSVTDELANSNSSSKLELPNFEPAQLPLSSLSNLLPNALAPSAGKNGNPSGATPSGDSVSGDSASEDSALGDSSDKSSTNSASAPDSQPVPTAATFALLKNAKSLVEDWPEVSTQEASVKRAAAIEIFAALSELGIQLDSVSDGRGAPELMRDRAQEIARSIKRQPDLAEVIQNAAKAQLNGNLPRSKDGWAMVCTVGSAEQVKDQWEVTISDPGLLALGEKIPKIEIPARIVNFVESGQRVLILGRFRTAANNGALPIQDAPPDTKSPTTQSTTMPPADAISADAVSADAVSADAVSADVVSADVQRPDAALGDASSPDAISRASADAVKRAADAERTAPRGDVFRATFIYAL